MRYTCWLIFPRCDKFEESLPLCQSACKNLLQVCKIEADCNADVVDGDDKYGIWTFFPR